jgi:hypothetical protein
MEALVQDKEQLHAILDPLHTRAHAAFFTAHAAFWAAEHDDADPLHLQVAEVGALMHLAATLAVDAGMNIDVFLATAQESYHDAYTQAPKWG